MPRRFKPIVVVNPETEKQLYRVMKDLEREQESIIENIADSYNSVAKKLALRTKNLKEASLIDEPWVVLNGKRIEKRLVRVPKSVVVKEEKGKEKSIFHFSRRKK